jgi:hypothetical protein
VNLFSIFDLENSVEKLNQVAQRNIQSYFFNKNVNFKIDFENRFAQQPSNDYNMEK